LWDWLWSLQKWWWSTIGSHGANKSYNKCCLGLTTSKVHEDPTFNQKIESLSRTPMIVAIATMGSFLEFALFFLINYDSNWNSSLAMASV
jgi:hypothetical protein